jgi:hypothetical protein
MRLHFFQVRLSYELLKKIAKKSNWDFKGAALLQERMMGNIFSLG